MSINNNPLNNHRFNTQIMLVCTCIFNQLIANICVLILLSLNTEIQHLSQHFVSQCKFLKLETYESCEEHVVGGVVVLVGLESNAESETSDDPRKHQPMTEKEECGFYIRKITPQN